MAAWWPPRSSKFLDARTHLAGATRNRYLTALSAVYRYATLVGITVRNPTRVVRRARETLQPLTLLPLEAQGGCSAHSQGRSARSSCSSSTRGFDSGRPSR